MQITLTDIGDPRFSKALKKAFPDADVFIQDGPLGERFAESDIVITGRNFRFGAEAVMSLRHCRAIIRNGIGYNNIDTAAARRAGIDVFNMQDYCIDDVAEHTMAMLLAYSRRLMDHARAESLLTAAWGSPSDRMFRLKGKKLGVVGLGNIGSAVAARAAAFGMQIGCLDPALSRAPCPLFHDLKELAAWADILTVHVPLTPATKGFLCADVFEKSRGIVLINTSRGGVVVYEDVLRCMKEGRIGAFLTDVLDREPPDGNPVIHELLDPDSPLRDRILITPHVAFSSFESAEDLTKSILALLSDLLTGRTPLRPVH